MALKWKSWVWIQALVAATMAYSALADEVVSPKNGQGWGEANTAESLLNMNRDPETVRKVDPDRVPIQVKGSCTDESGKTYTGEDEEYSLCMNRNSAKKKSVAPAAVPKKN